MIKIEDIAKVAGVSVSTVSLALNDKKGVSETTRQRIKSLAHDMNYIPLKSSAIQIQKKNIRFIAAINNEVLEEDYRSQPFFKSLIDHLIAESSNERFNITISTIDKDVLQKELIQMVTNEQTDGFIILSTDLTDTYIQQLKTQLRVPIVFLDANFDLVDATLIGINNAQGVHLATQYILTNGHQKIGYIMSENRINNFNQRKERFFSILKDKDITIDPSFIYTLSPKKIEAQADKVLSLTTQNSLPTVFFCENDLIAISFIKSAQELGFHVPNDFSVIGFDNITEAAIITPELTTISVNKKDLILTALDQLLRMMDNPTYTCHSLICCRLIERNSFKTIH